MSSYVIIVSKKTKDVSSTDPNDHIFNSEYNTFKIIKSGIKNITLAATTNGQLFYQPHILSCIPLVTAFAKQSGYSHVFSPNSSNIYMYGSKAGIITTGVTFVSIGTNSTNIIFKFDNSGGAVNISIRYYCLEAI